MVGIICTWMIWFLIVLVDLVCGGYSFDWWVCVLRVVLGFDLWVPRV